MEFWTQILLTTHGCGEYVTDLVVESKCTCVTRFGCNFLYLCPVFCVLPAWDLTWILVTVREIFEEDSDTEPYPLTEQSFKAEVKF